MKLPTFIISGAILAAALTASTGCGDSAGRSSEQERDRYGEEVAAITTSIQAFYKDLEKELGPVLQDSRLSREEKASRIVDAMDRLNAKTARVLQKLEGISPPSDLRSFHSVLSDDLRQSQAMLVEYRNAMERNAWDEVRQIGERIDAYEAARPVRLLASARSAGLDVPGESLSSLEAAIKTQKLGSGAGFWGSLWEALALFLRWETWLAVGLYSIAIFASAMLVLLGAAGAEGVKEGAGCAVGCVGMLFSTAVQVVAMGICVAALLPVIAGTGGFALGEAIDLWKPILSAGFLALLAITVFGAFCRGGCCLDAFPEATHSLIGGAIATALVDNARQQAGLSSGFSLPLLQVGGILAIGAVLTYLIVLAFAAGGIGLSKVARVEDEQKVEGCMTLLVPPVGAACQWIPLL